MKPRIDQYLNNTKATANAADYSMAYSDGKVSFTFAGACQSEREYYNKCFICVALWAENTLEITETPLSVAIATAELLSEKFHLNKRKSKTTKDTREQAKRVLSYLDSLQ